MRAIDDPVQLARAARIVRSAVRRTVEQSRREQGLPPHVEDREVLARIATLIDGAPKTEVEVTNPVIDALLDEEEAIERSMV